MKKAIVIIMVVSGIFFTGCKKEVVDPKFVELGGDAPALTGLEWIKGEPVTIKQGHVYLVEFWKVDDPYCTMNIPYLTKVQAAYKDKITIVGIAIGDLPIEKVKEFVDEQGEAMEYAVAYDAAGQAKKVYTEAYNQKGLPHVFIIDQKGDIVWVGDPMQMEEVLQQIVDGTYEGEL